MDMQQKNQIYKIEEKNIKIARLASQAFNTGDISKVHEFISPDYINRVSVCHWGLQE